MEMLTFVELLKSVIYEIEQTGGDPLQRIAPPPRLVQLLKQEAFRILRGIDGTPSYIISTFLLDEFSGKSFDEGIRVSYTFLRMLGIHREEIEGILSAASEERILRFLSPKGIGRYGRNDSESVRDALIISVSEVWEMGGTEVSRAYTFAKERALISWNYRGNQWNVTNLGRFFLELSPFHAVCFLLTVDICLSSGEHDQHHLSRDQLQSALEHLPRGYFTSNSVHRWNLQWMGIFSEERGLEGLALTPLGKKVLEYVLSENNLMLDSVVLFLREEEQGLAYGGSQLEVEKLENVLDSSLIDDISRGSIERALKLYKDGQYLDGLKILYPCIEEVINKILTKMGEQPDKYAGWKKKADYLETKGVIPTDITSAVEIIASRNKILHGQFVPPDPEYAYPLFQLAVIYLHRLLGAWSRFKEGISAKS
jgi:hypothetical protein